MSDSEKIDRYINGVPDENDKEFMDSLLTNGHNNSNLRNALEKDWENISNSAPSDEVKLDSLLDRIHHVISSLENQKGKKTIIRILETYKKIAAILIIPLLLASVIFYLYSKSKEESPLSQNSTIKIFAPFGSRVNFNLPDGTKGMLNSGSFLSYSMPFQQRNVELEGEAWFEVSHDESNPFRIKTGSSEVKVLGTRFNLSAYPSENYVEVVLLDGEVEFSGNDLKSKITISPSERLIYRDGTIDTSATDPLKYNAWTTGKLVFRGDPMTEVARRIERWYNVRIILADKELENYSFRGTFQDDKLEEVLKFLSLTSPIAYSIAPREQSPDGTIKSQIVTISLRNNH